MNIPESQKVIDGINGLRNNSNFVSFLNWIEFERDARDVDNRRKGFENLTTESEALSTILKVTGHKCNKKGVANVIFDANDTESEGWL